MWVKIVFILFAVLIFFIVRAHYLANKELVEKFEEIQQNSMSKFERFAEIIKAFESIKKVKPSPNELHALYDHMSSKQKYNSDDVKAVISNDAEFKKIVDAFVKRNITSPDVVVDVNPEKQTETSNDISYQQQDEVDALVEKSYLKLLPGEKLTSENKDFLMYKFQKLGNDLSKLEEYITTNDEYKNFIKKRIDSEFTKHSPSDQLDGKMFKIARPDVNETTLKVVASKSDDGKLSCKDLDDEHVLAKIINERNLAQLKYDCLRGNDKQASVNDNMVLLPDQKWSVPQQHPDVCRMSGEFSYKPSVEQTALIGTLLEDAKYTQVGTILPEFEFKEK